jgi:hypothetical protein
VLHLGQLFVGVHLVDQGGRDGNRIIVRGLNADPIGGSEGVGNGTGGMVATYVGEVPIVLDLKLNDMERVEFLLGPQGTLYGAGTMAGAIRYIPRRPSFAAPELIGRGATARVFLAVDMELHRTFAVKQMLTGPGASSAEAAAASGPPRVSSSFFSLAPFSASASVTRLMRSGNPSASLPT